MRKASYNSIVIGVWAVVAVVAMGDAVQVSMAAAASCNPFELSPCSSAIMSATMPTQVCCKKIREQKPCLCKYLANPNFKKFVNSPNAAKVAAVCGTPFPKC
ncbi:non-specific lipid-transfer protein 2-like [Malania oleifera]|uniref:non-specific lipid-transfer protein 2-like n=1 Tax=Malania oleifera TaxID=397392 RepID=UPI0025AE1CE1|nr:non-specific lipid-transfer protein 2-like [Malania oleifera]